MGLSVVTLCQIRTRGRCWANIHHLPLVLLLHYRMMNVDFLQNNKRMINVNGAALFWKAFMYNYSEVGESANLCRSTFFLFFKKN
jgi:hypothetical protein